MRTPHGPKLSEREQLARRRRRALTVSSSVLAVTLFGSWLSLRAWSDDALPGWLRAPGDAVSALSALLPGALETSTREVRARRAIAPAAQRVPQVAAKAARARAATASVSTGAQAPVLGSVGGDASESQGTTNTEATVAAEVGANAQPSQPLIDPGPAVDPTAPVPGVEVPTPDDVAPILDTVGGTVGDVVGTLLPDDFSLNLSPRVGNTTLGVDANVGVEVGGESGVQTHVAAEVDAVVTTVDVATQVALTPESTQVGLGLGSELANATVAVNTASGVGAQVDLAGAAVAASVPVSGSPTSVDVSANLLGLEVDQAVRIGGDGKGAPLVELPNLGIGLLGSQ